MEYQLPGQDNDEYISLCPFKNTSDPCYFWGNNNAGKWNTHWSNWSVDGKWQRDGIAWETDKESKFNFVALGSGEINQGPRQNQTGLNLPKVDDEDFIVWMRAAALPDFRKLHRIIYDVTLPKDTKIRVHVASWFPTKDFGGEKWVTIAKTEWCGGANHALAWTYIVVACVAIGLTVTFAILLLFGSRYLYLSLYFISIHSFIYFYIQKNG